jgi:DNA-binding transcriptional ArsR family regulator
MRRYRAPYRYISFYQFKPLTKHRRKEILFICKFILYEKEGKIVTSKPQNAVYIVDDPEKIRLLADFTRTEILRILNKSPLTETQLSEQLSLTKAAVGYHLHLLLNAGLICIEKVESEKHGILQKYYRPIAALFIVDPNKIPRDVQRHYIQIQIDHLIGMLSALQLNHKVPEISTKSLEELARAMLKELMVIGQKYVGQTTTENGETLKIKIYAEAMKNLVRNARALSTSKKVK